MNSAPPPLTWGPESPFAFVGGEPALDLINTAAWTDRGLVNDRLTDYGRLTDWAVAAGLVPRAEGERLRREAVRRPAEAARAWEAGRALRAVLQQVGADVAGGVPLDDALHRFQPYLHDALTHLRLVTPGLADRGRGRAAQWSWHGADDRLDAFLWPVVRNLADLLTSDEASRIRICGGEGCGWMYVDRSRNGLRRWCEMATCGTRAKTRRRASERPPRVRGPSRGR